MSPPYQKSCSIYKALVSFLSVLRLQTASAKLNTLARTSIYHTVKLV